MEKIIGIRDYESMEGSSNVAGFEVITDKQSINLYIENDRSCCEKWGYFWCNENPVEFIGSELLSVSLTDTELNEAKMKANGADIHGKYFEGGVMFVNLETCRGTLQFVAYNEHNGHYGHKAKVQCAQLTHASML